MRRLVSGPLVERMQAVLSVCTRILYCSCRTEQYVFTIGSVAAAPLKYRNNPQTLYYGAQRILLVYCPSVNTEKYTQQRLSNLESSSDLLHRAHVSFCSTPVDFIVTVGWPRLMCRVCEVRDHSEQTHITAVVAPTVYETPH